MKVLTKAEWSVMSALWKKSPIFLSELIELMGETVHWNYNTYSSYLRKLCEKGYIGFETVRRDKRYFPAITKSECVLYESRFLISKIREDTAKEFLMCMIKESELTLKDQQDLKKLLDELVDEGKRK